ncbi:MAG: hypothetical protein BWZ10_03279 [candidate division BRC1 bacterium ADurb.BinA364]|nr:MAG: hypothetical protein BWZ10_03279 [candidate division BRC1 bacterium ADurb.BinA364]
MDEDPKFEADSIVFRFPPSAASSLESRISFFVGEFENRSHTLIKRTEYLDAANTVVSTEEAPLADGVLSFAALYWQPNGTSMYWVTEWDSAAALVDAEPYLPLPAAIWLGLAVYADDRPIETYVPGMPVRVEHLSTVVTIESTINDPRYRRW